MQIFLNLFANKNNYLQFSTVIKLIMKKITKTICGIILLELQQYPFDFDKSRAIIQDYHNELNGYVFTCNFKVSFENNNVHQDIILQDFEFLTLFRKDKESETELFNLKGEVNFEIRNYLCQSIY